MLSLKKPLLSLALAASLVATACGFTPVHAPGGNGHALYGQVYVATPEQTSSRGDSNAYMLVRDLEDRLGRGGNGAYQLDLTLSTRIEGQAITAGNEITRYSIIGDAGYSLLRRSDGAVMASGTETAFTGYSATGTTVETLAGESDAFERLMRILADQITAKLYATADLSTPSVAAPAE